jgi:hypothetical protein
VAFPLLTKAPNKAHAVDAPITSPFAFVRQGRRATDVHRSPKLRRGPLVDGLLYGSILSV